MIDKQLFKELKQEYALYKKEAQATILALQKKNATLEDLLYKYKSPKNSTNSSITPSQDTFRKTKSLRIKSKGPQGGQKGSKLNKVSTAR